MSSALSEGPVVRAQDLRRSYRTRTGTFRRERKEVEAVRGVSFDIAAGELFGLLGPNGAGKTTTIKMLITLLLPTGGSAEVLGHDVVADAREVRRHIGYVFGGDRGLYERLSALDNLRYFAELYGVPPREQRERIGMLLEMVGLTGREKERVEGFSRGMRQRLHIARGLLHDPEVLFLDEPTIGIDPVGARELRATIAAAARSRARRSCSPPTTCSRPTSCATASRSSGAGEIVAEGAPSVLKQRVTAGHVVEVETFGLPDEAADAVRRLAGVRSATVEERGQAQVLMVQVEPGAEITSSVLGLLSGVNVGRVSSREPSLEDAYVELVSNGSPVSAT